MSIKVEKVAENFTPLAGLDAGRNGTNPNGKAARALAEALNFLLGRCQAQIPGKGVLPASTRNVTTELRLWTTRYLSSSNGTTLRVEVLLAPTDNNSTPQPEWYVKVDGVSSDKRYHSNRVDSGEGNDLQTTFVDHVDVTVTTEAKHTVDIYTANCRVVSWSLRELERDTLIVGTDVVMDWAQLSQGHSINWQDLDSMRQLIEKVRRYYRGCPLSWSVDDPASPVTIVGDGSFHTLWNAAMTPLIPSNHWDDEDDFLAASPNGIPMNAWIQGERTAGSGTGQVRFTSGSGDQTTINIPTSLGVVDADWDVIDGSSDDTVKVEYKAPVSTTCKLYALGAFPIFGA